MSADPGEARLRQAMVEAVADSLEPLLTHLGLSAAARGDIELGVVDSLLAADLVPTPHAYMSVARARDRAEADARSVAHEDAERSTEWRVTGEPGGIYFRGERVGSYPSYDFIWRLGTRGRDGRPIADYPSLEAAARRFVEACQGDKAWEDGPHLSRRAVVTGPWEPA